MDRNHRPWSRAATGRNFRADGKAALIHCLSYGNAEGLASPICSGGFQPGACKNADGMLWFPTSKGLAIVDPVNVTTNTAEPPVVIEELLVDGKPVIPKSRVPTLEPQGEL